MWIKTEEGNTLVNLNNVSSMFIWGETPSRISAIIAGKENEAYHEEETLFAGSKAACQKVLDDIISALAEGFRAYTPDYENLSRE